MGRNTKCTPERVEAIVEAVRGGLTWQDAARIVGVCTSTISNWRQKATEGKRPFVAFLEAVKAAEAEAKQTWLQEIRDAARSGTWQAAAWLLERKHFDEFGRTLQRLEHTGKDGAPLKIQVEWETNGDSDD